MFIVHKCNRQLLAVQISLTNFFVTRSNLKIPTGKYRNKRRSFNICQNIFMIKANYTPIIKYIISVIETKLIEKGWSWNDFGLLHHRK